MRIVCSITARPSFSRIESVLRVLQASSEVELTVLVSCSALAAEYGEISKIIKAKGYEICELHTLAHGDGYQDVCTTAGETLKQVGVYLANNRPDFLITVADRFETLSVAAAAANQNIPIIHIQGGEISGNIDERIRHSVTKLSDYHFVATQKARLRLIAMGENPSNVFNYGCPSLDLVRNMPLMSRSETISKINAAGNGYSLDVEDEFLVCLAHPETEEVGSNAEYFSQLLTALKFLNMPTIYFWPNMDIDSRRASKVIRQFREFEESQYRVRFVKNVESDLFLNLVKNSRCLIGNSSAGLREAGFLGAAVVNIGQRQRGRERDGNVVDCQWGWEEIVSAVNSQLSAAYEPSLLYGDGSSGKKIADRMISLPLPEAKVFYE